MAAIHPHDLLARGWPRRSLLLGAAAAGMGATGARAQGLGVIRFANSSTSLSSAPLLLADTAPEIFAKHGIRLEMRDFRGSAPNTLTAIISGAMDMCMVGVTGANDAIAEGADLKAIAIYARPMSEILLSAATVKKLGVAPDAPAEQRLKALKGLRIVSSGPGGSHWTYLVEMLRPLGMKITDLSFTTLTDPIAMMQGIRNNQIDGAMWTVGSLSPIVKDGSGVRWLVMVKDAQTELKDLPFLGIYSRSDWLEKNGDVALRFRAGLIDAIARLKNDRETSSKLIKARYFPDVEQAAWDDSYGQAVAVYIDDAKARRDPWSLVQKFQAESTRKDYARASFERVVIPQARGD